jgi:hypothetical protein
MITDHYKYYDIENNVFIRFNLFNHFKSFKYGNHHLNNPKTDKH